MIANLPGKQQLQAEVMHIQLETVYQRTDIGVNEHDTHGARSADARMCTSLAGSKGKV